MIIKCVKSDSCANNEQAIWKLEHKQFMQKNQERREELSKTNNNEKNLFKYNEEGTNNFLTDNVHYATPGSHAKMHTIPNTGPTSTWANNLNFSISDSHSKTQSIQNTEAPTNTSLLVNKLNFCMSDSLLKTQSIQNSERPTGVLLDNNVNFGLPDTSTSLLANKLNFGIFDTNIKTHSIQNTQGATSTLFDNSENFGLSNDQAKIDAQLSRIVSNKMKFSYTNVNDTDPMAWKKIFMEKNRIEMDNMLHNRAKNNNNRVNSLKDYDFKSTVNRLSSIFEANSMNNANNVVSDTLEPMDWQTTDIAENNFQSSVQFNDFSNKNALNSQKGDDFSSLFSGFLSNIQAQQNTNQYPEPMDWEPIEENVVANNTLRSQINPFTAQYNMNSSYPEPMDWE